MNSLMTLAFSLGILAALQNGKENFSFSDLKKWPQWFLILFETAVLTALFCGILTQIEIRYALPDTAAFFALLLGAYAWVKIRKRDMFWLTALTAFCFSARLFSPNYPDQLRYAAAAFFSFSLFWILLEGLKFRMALMPLNRHLRGPAGVLLAAFFLSLAFSGLKNCLERFLT